MIKYEKVGDIEVIQQEEFSEFTQKLLREALDQNRLILIENCRIMRLISSPIMVIKDAKDENETKVFEK